jgi:DNA-binding NtrC family response regulator
VALRRILVVDDSPAVRETVSILLAGDYDVQALGADEIAARGIPGPLPNLIIAARAVGRGGHVAAFPPGTPVLWIDSPGDTPTGAAGPSIPRRFSPRELRQRVAELLIAPGARAASPPAPSTRLQPPYVTSDAARAIGQALDTELPLHLVGESGTGKRFVARAIHAARGNGPFLPSPGAHFDTALLTIPAAQGGTLFIDRADQLGGAAQQALLANIDPTGRIRLADGATLRLLSSATTDLGIEADCGRFAPDLFYRMTVLTVRLTPLRERPDDIAALAQMLSTEIAGLLGRSPVVLTDRALNRLSNYLWFGNLAELEAVLARTVALCHDTVIDADDLLFDGARVRPSNGNAAAPVREGRTALGGRPLDLIINELAHEFKNPLVTIKTFAHHLRRAIPSGGDEEQVARLTGEAVAQIDQTLENLLEFTRLETPVPQSIPLSAVLNPVLRECAEALAPRGIALDHPPAPAVTVRGDPQQLAYGLTNLVRALTRDLEPASRVAVRYGAPAALTIELPNGTEPLASHLATLLDRPSDGSPAVPLGVAIANAVLERNGAHVALADDTPSTVTVRFSPADENGVVAGNGTAPRSHR